MKRGAFWVLACCGLAVNCFGDEHLVAQDAELECSDGSDDDNDGDADCLDLDCEEDPACDVGIGNDAAGADAGGADGATPGAGAAGAPTAEQGGASAGPGGAGGASSAGSAGAPPEIGGEGPGPSGLGSCQSPVAGVIGDYELLPAYADSSDFTSGSCQAATTGVDVAYLVTGTANGILEATAYSTDSDVDISVRSVCADAGSELDCQSYNTSGMADVVTTPITVGQQVIVVVSRASSAAQTPAYLQLKINN